MPTRIVCVLSAVLAATAARASITSVELSRGTVEDSIVIRGVGLAPKGKAKVRFLLDGRKAKGTKVLVRSATDNQIGAYVEKAKPGLYDVEVRPKGGTAMVREDAYEICLVENVVATPRRGAPGDTLTIAADCIPGVEPRVKIGGKRAKLVTYYREEITVTIPDLPDGLHDLEIKTTVGTTLVPGGVQIGGESPVDDQIVQATINGRPFESTPPSLVVTATNVGVPVFSVFAGSNVDGDSRTLQFVIAFDPATMTSGVFETSPVLSQFSYIPSAGVLFGLDVDETSLVTSGVVSVTGNVEGKVSGTFNAELIPYAPAGGAGVSVESGVFVVRVTP